MTQFQASYIKVCKKDDPELNKCLMNLFESLRPKLKTGIPEIDLPPLDPLLLPEVIIMKGGNGQMKAIGRNIKVTGVSNMKLNYIKANVPKLEVEVSVFFPFLRFEGIYDVNARVVTLPVVGKGPMKGNATDIRGHAVLKAKFIENSNEKYVQFHTALVDVDVKDYHIQVEHLFPDKQLNEAINALLNDRKVQSITSAKPIINKVAANMILEMINKIAKNVDFQQVFA